MGIGKAAQKKHAFCAGEEVSGQSYPVPVPKLESVEFYRTSALKKHSPAAPPSPHQGPPWLGVCPNLETYRGRGHRRLDKRTYEQQCQSCMWGCRMAVEIIVDHWKPDVRRYRYETFCYGPKSCALHRSGPKRKVPGRKGMTYTEEGLRNSPPIVAQTIDSPTPPQSEPLPLLVDYYLDSKGEDTPSRKLQTREQWRRVIPKR